MDQQQRIDGSSDYAQIPVNVRGGGLASSNKYQNYDDIPVGGSGSRGGYDYSGSSNFSASSMIPNSDASVGSMNMQNLLGSTTTTTTSSSASTMMQPPAQSGIPQQPLDSDYTTLVHRLKQHIFGYDNDYSRDTSFQVPLVLPEGVKTSITEVPEQLQKMLAEREPTFDRELPTRDFFKDIPEREVVRHRIVHPVQVQTIKHIVTHPPKRIEVRHTAPHIVEHVVEHEIPHEIQHVVQHVVPYSVEHVISHDVKENVKHVLSHKVHQLVNHDIKEEIKHNILHGVQKFQQPGMNESEIQEDNRIPHSVTRSAPLINTSITNRLIEDFQERLHLSGATGIERTERTITATDLISSNPQQQEGMGSAMQQPIGPGLGGAALDGASSMPMKGRSSVAAAEAERVDSASA